MLNVRGQAEELIVDQAHTHPTLAPWHLIGNRLFFPGTVQAMW